MSIYTATQIIFRGELKWPRALYFVKSEYIKSTGSIAHKKNEKKADRAFNLNPKLLLSFSLKITILILNVYFMIDSDTGILDGMLASFAVRQQTRETFFICGRQGYSMYTGEKPENRPKANSDRLILTEYLYICAEIRSTTAGTEIKNLGTSPLL
ncbi:hypothetical protein C1N59_21005 (plasmid) [Pantoea sp. SGAir0183]